ncbi:uncharacterized protein LOC119369116 isoform X2 [Jatropha curcas]|uniref:uncharacterized protein LOC119369116 isoform X1 n=1 Tax=Jatropha curcas TaxID=180498 RepID=UPI001892FD20|nr:uncharacterized protein LOC119369116 isoform X1 [Jatropha curcas]XP_037496113.1 uncharacterized protein LOC119369116 isoform X2 [Jatropha curcas]
MTFVSSSASAVMAASSESEILDYTLFNEKVAFPNLVQVQISNADALRKIWHNQLHSDSFYKLRVMKVEYGNQLVQIFPSNIFKRLENLNDVVIGNCDSLEVVFDLQELVINITESITSELRNLDIRNLQNLKYVWNKDPQQALSFPNLSSVHVWHCPSLKNLFPTSIAKNLLQLKKLDLSNCGLKELVTKEEEVETNPKFAFPQLKSLDLWRLNELNCFYPGSHTLECPVLEKLAVFHCDKLETLTFEPVDSNLQETQMENALFSFREIINNLEHLSLTRKDATTILEGQFPEDLFHMLKFIQINCYHDESAVFPFDLLERFHSMEKLAVGCSQFKELFPHEGHVGKEKYVKTVGQIRHLELYALANLEHIWNQDSQLDKVLQSLEILSVWRCDSLITLAPSSASFQNLTTMVVKSCKVLASLMTSSTAKSLVQLTRLSIRECDMLIEIVASEGNDGSREEIIFNKLETLELLYLPSLVSFCAAEHSFKFPSLTLVIVEQCPKMQVFSSGVLSTPKLQTLRVTGEQGHEGRWNGNLNATIQQLFTEMNAEEDQSPSIEC